MSVVRKLDQEILVNGLSDYVGFWEPVRLLRRREPRLNESELKKVILMTIRSLVDDDLMEFGEVNVDGTFSTWALTSHEAISVIRDQWDSLGRDPNVGEIVWMHNTLSGDTAARALIENVSREADA